MEQTTAQDLETQQSATDLANSMAAASQLGAEDTLLMTSSADLSQQVMTQELVQTTATMDGQVTVQIAEGMDGALVAAGQTIMQDGLVSDTQLQNTLNQQVRSMTWLGARLQNLHC